MYNVVNILEITKSCILKWVKWQILCNFYLKYFKNVILYEARKNRIKTGMKVDSNFVFTWVGQGSPICHLRTAEGDGGVSHRDSWAKSILGGKQFSKLGDRNRLRAVCSMKSKVTKMGRAE